MLLKIYLGISFLVFMCMMLYVFSLKNKIREKYDKEIKERVRESIKKDIPGSILSLLELLILSFIPIFNVILLILFIFFEKDLNEKIDEKLANILK